ncbi:hypothetical protein P152DRAFT_514936 [Eremomyces bilateralis CBS 781.70]|uniref:Ubiquitin-like domain-containing protein n=1 Tax=Eremomyces bilateralis CBS 781.70 TaxID=1392243 RepID=A0A6G1G1J8_9PEZI|nr:uncharacterized protein P152DRAFT_514936 [Eremomyces bilateralis CBS 781.70]KAF1811806.1 hypothetical protein P152DRAFT_514936 [Eremomyces bilateralis CBS 781.70]
MADDHENEDRGNDLELRILSPSSELPGPLTLKVPISTTVAELKLRVKNAVASKPEPSRQRLIHKGRVMANESEDLASIFGAEHIKNSEYISLHLVLKDLQTSGPPRSSTAPPGAMRSPLQPYQTDSRLEQPRGIPTSHPVGANPSSSVALGTTPATNAGAIPAQQPNYAQGIPSFGFMPVPSPLGLHQQAVAMAQGHLHPAMQAAFPPQLHPHGLPPHIHGAEAPTPSPHPNSNILLQPHAHTQQRMPAGSPDFAAEDGNQHGIPGTRGRLNASHSDPNLAARANAQNQQQQQQQQQQSQMQPGSFTNRPANARYTVTMESRITSVYPGPSNPPHVAHPMTYTLPQGPPVFAQPSNRAQPRIQNQASTQVYLLSSPSGPHALLVGPSGTYSSDNLSPNIWSTLLNSQSPLERHDTSASNAAQRFRTSVDPQPSSSRQLQPRFDQHTVSQHPTHQHPGHYPHHHHLHQHPHQPSSRQPHPQPANAEAPPVAPIPVANAQNAQPNIQPHALPNGVPNADDNAGELRNLLLPAMGHLWLAVRLIGLWYLFNGSASPFSRGFDRIMVLVGFITLVYLAYLGGFLGDSAQRVRRYWDALVFGDEQQQPGQEGAGAGVDTNGSAQGLHRPARGQQRTPPNPAQLANRIHDDTPLNRFLHEARERVRTVERGVALFVASLYPGFGERVIRERQRREEEQARQGAEVVEAEVAMAAAAAAVEGQAPDQGVREGEGRMQQQGGAPGPVDGAEPQVIEDQRPLWDLGDGRGRGGDAAVATGRDDGAGSEGLSARGHGSTGSQTEPIDAGERSQAADAGQD